MRCVLLLALVCSWSALAETAYEVVPGWPQVPPGHDLGVCAGVAVDTRNHVFVFHRSGRQWTSPFPKEPIDKPTVSVFDGDTGELLSSWGAHRFIMPHGLSVDHQGHVWLTDVGLHQVMECTAEGRVLRTWGEPGVSGTDPGHFNLPTDVAVLRDGGFYVSDGYKNTRVMKFDATGRFQFQWGTKGAKAGEFDLPHGIAVDAAGRVLVCDRENERVQVFNAAGHYVTEWKGPQIGKPYGIACSRDGRVHLIDGGSLSLKQSLRGKVVVLDSDGQVQDTFGEYGTAPGQFRLGHDIAVGVDGSVYVAEATGLRVQKFRRRK